MQFAVAARPAVLTRAPPLAPSRHLSHHLNPIHFQEDRRRSWANAYGAVWAVGGALVSIRVLLSLPLLPVSAVLPLAAANGAERAVGGTVLGWVAG